MIRYVNLKNYKSLVNLSVDFMQTKIKPKNVVVIYGENGIGKSNFATSFYTLNETMQTMSSVEQLDRILEFRDKEISNEKYNEFIERYIRDSLKNTDMIIKEYKTIASEENMVLEFGFRIKGKNGYYKIEYNNEEIVSENLDYVLNKNQSYFVNITAKNKDINKNIFTDTNYYKEIKDLTDKYWGKHSFLSIISHEVKDKKRNYVKNKLSKGFYEVFEYLQSISTKVIGGNHTEFGRVGVRHNIPKNFIKGTISIKDEEYLNKVEKFINYFFDKLYADIKKVYYEKEIKNNKIYYNLMVRKKIYGKIIDIGFEKESTGTMNLLELIPYFISACEGQTVIIDELDKGIHDLLVDKILDNIIDYIKGQLIITTHNTLLMESRIPNKDIYVFNVNKNAEKELIPITEFNGRIHKNINPRKQYLMGMYGGVPYMSDIDFDELLNNLE